MAKKGKKHQPALEHMPIIHPHAAGIDVGAEEHWVGVPADRDTQPVQQFSAFTCDLYRLADWLTACRITTVVMESTGVYWIPLFQILEARGFAVALVNARHVKNVPGRPKTDRFDGQWLQRLPIVSDSKEWNETLGSNKPFLFYNGLPSSSSISISSSIRRSVFQYRSSMSCTCVYTFAQYSGVISLPKDSSRC